MLKTPQGFYPGTCVQTKSRVALISSSRKHPAIPTLPHPHRNPLDASQNQRHARQKQSQPRLRSQPQAIRLLPVQNDRRLSPPLNAERAISPRTLPADTKKIRPLLHGALSRFHESTGSAVGPRFQATQPSTRGPSASGRITKTGAAHPSPWKSSGSAESVLCRPCPGQRGGTRRARGERKLHARARARAHERPRGYISVGTRARRFRQVCASSTDEEETGEAAERAHI